MDERLKTAYTKVIHKYYAAVETDVRLDNLDLDDTKYSSLERKSRQFWDDFQKVEDEFKTLLEHCAVRETEGQAS